MTLTTQPTPLVIDEAYLRDPFPKLDELRNLDPVHWVPSLNSWLVTRYDDVRSLFADPRMSRDRKLSAYYVEPPKGTWAYRFDHESFAVSSPEEHRKWRNSIAAAFKPKAVARMEQQVREVVEQFAAPLRGRKGTVDLIAEFTNPIPNTVISRITGIPPYPGDEDRFRSLAQDVIRRFILYAETEHMERGERAISELAEWVGKLADDRRQIPQEDMISDLIHGEHGEAGMNNDEIVMLVAGLVAAGSETTTLGGSTALRLLFEHPDQLERLRADPSLALNAVRETLRFEFGSATAAMARYALEDVELRGKQIQKGQQVMLSSAAAHRDPALYPNPNKFDITRDTTETLAFGHGPYYCIGANLALQEMTCMLDAALDFIPPGASLRKDEVQWESIGLMRRPVNLPIDFG